MAKKFGEAEHYILSLFDKGTSFIHNKTSYKVVLSGKPTCKSGEPKTDIYIKAIDTNHNLVEFKISFKKKNADFLENKTTSERAEQLFGSNWENIIFSATSTLRSEFLSRMLIYKEKLRQTDKGAITLGWKFELLNVKSGHLSGDMHLTQEQVLDIYAGTNLTREKQDAFVNGIQIQNSGIANYILFENTPIASAQEAVDSLITVDDYVDENPNVYFSCKALNFRTFHQKYDGNRPLAVYVDWFVSEGKLDYRICFNTPLKQRGDYVCSRLNQALSLLHVETTDDLNASNVKDQSIIYKRI